MENKDFKFYALILQKKPVKIQLLLQNLLELSYFHWKPYNNFIRTQDVFYLYHNPISYITLTKHINCTLCNFGEYY